MLASGGTRIFVTGKAENARRSEDFAAFVLLLSKMRFSEGNESGRWDSSKSQNVIA
jgi:hypothetical protein